MLMLTMSRVLSELLGVTELLFKLDLQRLESASGRPSIDVRLTAEIIGKVQMKTRELGLDPRDSTGREVYYALMNLVKLHDSFLSKRIGLDPDDTVDKQLHKIRDAALQVDIPRSSWVLKHSAAKRLIKAHPPKQAMKLLGYKSLDSMLKREPMPELFAAVRLVESENWYESFIASYKHLTPMDFEVRKIEIKIPDGKKWHTAAEKFVSRHRHNILTVRELGAILILPVELPKQIGLTITLLPLVLHHINEIRLYSAFYKLHQMRPNFGQVIAGSLLHDVGNHVGMAGHKVHWRVVSRHFGRAEHHPEVLEPHVVADDLLWRKAEEVLYKIEPALYFWYDLDYVASPEPGRPLSFNLMDMAINTLNNISYDQRVYGHFQDGLWNELYIRYLGQPALESHVLKQLDYETTAPEVLAMMRRN